MSLDMTQFPSLDDTPSPSLEGVSFLGSSQMTQATTSQIGEAVEAKTRGQKAAETRRKNREAKAKEKAAKEAAALNQATGQYPGPKQPEIDPSGLDAHMSGAKLDAGKPDLGTILALFPRSLFAVASVGQFGAMKYSLGGFLEVDNGVHRYTSAGVRHMLKNFIGEDLDSDSAMLHMAHEAWNALAKLELHLRQRGETGEFNIK
jgi:hypothetical protein